MGALVHSSNVQYAIIQASSMKNHPERLVIRYPDENSLRDLIAAPSIVGLGFASREEAMVNLVDSIPDPNASERIRPRAISDKSQQNINSAAGRALDNDDKIPIRILQFVLSTAIVLFYSKNLVSTIIRTALGASS